jgi:hypothetical protein
MPPRVDLTNGPLRGCSCGAQRSALAGAALARDEDRASVGATRPTSSKIRTRWIAPHQTREVVAPPQLLRLSGTCFSRDCAAARARCRPTCGSWALLHSLVTKSGPAFIPRPPRRSAPGGDEDDGRPGRRRRMRPAAPGHPPPRWRGREFMSCRTSWRLARGGLQRLGGEAAPRVPLPLGSATGRRRRGVVIDEEDHGGLRGTALRNYS